MNILLTNDDGYNYKGIRLLKEKLSKYGRVIIVAPKGAMSAKSCSKTFGKPLKVVEEEKDIFSVEGTPADCVAIGITAFDIDFDLVVSGCNNGLNIANDALYSGTIGACLEALTYHKKCIAFSCEFNFEIVDKYFDDVYDYIMKNNLLSEEYLLNVNFPLGETVKDIKLGSVCFRNDHNYFMKNEEGGYVAYRDVQTEFDNEESDCYQVKNGIVSIVPLYRHFYNEALLSTLKKRIS